MKWVRAAARVVSDAEDQRDQTTGTDGESEDPFKDIESLKEDDSGDAQENVSISEAEVPDAVGKHDQTELSRIEDDGEDVEMNDREEVDLASFSFDGPSVAVIRIVPSDESEEGEEVRTSDSESDDHDGVANGGGREDAGVIFESEDESSPEPQDLSPIQPVSIACPIGVAPVTPHGKPSSLIASMPRPAPKSTSATPVSAMKDPNRERYCTPAHRLGHRRSVSFSDGKRDGPIRGLNPKGHESDDDVVSLATSISEQDPVQGSFIPSARSKRIAEMMQNLESPGKLLPFSLCCCLVLKYCKTSMISLQRSPQVPVISPRRNFSPSLLDDQAAKQMSSIAVGCRAESSQCRRKVVQIKIPRRRTLLS
jgi:hypothetical protein